MPKRIQRKRSKGWRMPLGAIYVGRPTKYANWLDWKMHGRAAAKEDFRRQLENWRNDDPVGYQQTLNELRGHDLACWCPLSEPCHADVWLEFANVAVRASERWKMEQGTVLYTKDGRRIGNAVVMNVDNHHKLGTVVSIKTDFGNTATLTVAEIDELFYIGPVKCLEPWLRDQDQMLIQMHTTCDEAEADLDDIAAEIKDFKRTLKGG